MTIGKISALSVFDFPVCRVDTMQEPLRWVIVLVLVLFCCFYYTISETKQFMKKQKFLWLTVLWTGKSKGREGTDVCLASGEALLCVSAWQHHSVGRAGSS